MKIIVLGNKGMLGHVVERYFKEAKYDVMGINRNEPPGLDVTNFNWLIQCLRLHTADVVINCTGTLNQEKDRNKQIDVNIVAPRILAKYCERVIHVSTNCVFQKLGPHSEEDYPDAESLYGKSKALGEIIDDKHLTIRTSITGPEIKTHDRSGLFDWFVNQSGNIVSGYINAFWNGVTTLQLAKFIEEAIKNNYTGLIHYYAKQIDSKYCILKTINKVYGLNKTIDPLIQDGVHSALLAGKYFTDKSFEEQFKELKEWY